MHFAVMKVLLDYLDLSQMSSADLARKLACSESYISHLLSGERIPSTRILKKMHEVTGIAYDKLVNSIQKL